jgi:aminoglycoside 6'-N-acetyltransferase I
MDRIHADVIVRAATPSDAAVWESMRRGLWPDGAKDHGPEIALFFAGHEFKDLAAALMAECRTGEIVGFAELSIRDDIPDLQGRRTGYVEGLYVLPELRHCGIAEKLLRASRAWAREQKCVAFASDRADRIIVDRTFAKLRPSGD